MIVHNVSYRQTRRLKTVLSNDQFAVQHKPAGEPGGAVGAPARRGGGQARGPRRAQRRHDPGHRQVRPQRVPCRAGTVDTAQPWLAPRRQVTPAAQDALHPLRPAPAEGQ